MKARKVLSLIAFPALFAVLLVLALVFRQQLLGLFRSPDSFRSWVQSTGPIAPLVFVGLQAAQVVVFFIPGEIPQVAGGYLFGVWQGSLLSLAGITLGASLNFLMARLLGLPFVYTLFGQQSVHRVWRIAESSRARLAFFLFFLIPGVPKDVLCYVAGLSSLRLAPFLLYSTLGRLPGVIGSALIGEAAADRRWLLAGSILFAAAALFGLGFMFRRRIQAFLESLARRGRREGGPPPGEDAGP
jgi:uncharacterized membrane protein YdjX (TVP38/TMEM64 family)